MAGGCLGVSSMAGALGRCPAGRLQAAAGDLGRQGAKSRQGLRAGIGLSISIGKHNPTSLAC